MDFFAWVKCRFLPAMISAVSLALLKSEVYAESILSPLSLSPALLAWSRPTSLSGTSPQVSPWIIIEAFSSVSPL